MHPSIIKQVSWKSCGSLRGASKKQTILDFFFNYYNITKLGSPLQWGPPSKLCPSGLLYKLAKVRSRHQGRTDVWSKTAIKVKTTAWTASLSYSSKYNKTAEEDCQVYARLLKRIVKFMHGHGLRSNPETYSVSFWDRTRSKEICWQSPRRWSRPQMEQIFLIWSKAKHGRKVVVVVEMTSAKQEC